MSQVPNALLDLVRQRACHRCEYCLIPEAYLFLHEPDHIIAVQHRGVTSLENLALACFDCNRRKGPNLSSVDPATGRVVALFHPRQDKWSEHFRLDGASIAGLSASGRATVELLQFNSAERLHVREELQRAGQYPLGA